MTLGPDTYRDPSDAAETAPVLPPGAKIAMETALASDEGWKATVRDETMPLRTLPNGQKIWHFPLQTTGKMVYGREATTRENLADLFQRTGATTLTMVARHERTNAPIFLCDEQGNLISSKEE
jgi:hypothetical protein